MSAAQEHYKEIIESMRFEELNDKRVMPHMRQGHLFIGELYFVTTTMVSDTQLAQHRAEATSMIRSQQRDELLNHVYKPILMELPPLLERITHIAVVAERDSSVNWNHLDTQHLVTALTNILPPRV